MQSVGRWGAAVLAASVLVWPELAVLLAHPGSAPPAPWTAWAAVITTPAVLHTWLLLVVLSGVGATYLVLTHGTATGQDSRDTTFGTARWGKPERAEGVALWTAGRSDNPVGLVVGADPVKGRVRHAWVSVQDGHALLIGAPGTRKSTSVLLPTLAVIGQAGSGLVVTDPKGELWESASGPLALEGYTVVRVDFRDPSASARWNALGPVVAALAAGH
ncbi:MAG: type IV secretory system conjugative DNA transfer family protein, partial [Clostridia bacterium]